MYCLVASVDVFMRSKSHIWGREAWFNVAFSVQLPSFILPVQFNSAPFARPVVHGTTTGSEPLSAEDGGIPTEHLRWVSGLSVPFGHFTAISLSMQRHRKGGNRKKLLFSDYHLYHTYTKIINVFFSAGAGE